MNYIELGKLLDYEQPTKYIVKDTKYDDSYKIPVLTAGQSFILGYTSEEENVFEKENLPVIIFDDFTTSSQFVDFQFKVKSSAMKILKAKTDINLKYVFYAMQMIRFDNQLHKRYWISQYSNIKIPVPSIAEQNKITKELDTLQNAIDLKKENLELLDNLIKSKFNEMFGNPITNERNYQMVDFIKVVKLQRGYDLPNQDRDRNGSIPVYGANGILDKHSISKSKNGIITGRSGTIGKVYYSFEDFFPLNTTLFSIETYGNNIIYLKYLLDMFDLKRFMDATGVPTLNRNVVHKQKIINVPIELQNKFVDFVKQIDIQKVQIKNDIGELKKLQENLMNKYFN